MHQDVSQNEFSSGESPWEKSKLIHIIGPILFLEAAVWLRALNHYWLLVEGYRQVLEAAQSSLP